MEKKIIYDNRSFVLGSAGRYYFGRVKGKSVSLHRYKYEKEVGPIPEGWHIHHKDGNCFNNEIGNLQPIDAAEHSKLHPASEDTLVKWQKAGIKKAPEWHSSPEGMAWHQNHYDNIKDKMHAKVKVNCSYCGTEILTQRRTVNTFCNTNCKSAWRRKNNPDLVKKNCEKCGSEFKTRKYMPARFCSKKCKPAPNPLGYRGRFKDPIPIINVSEEMQKEVNVITAQKIINNGM